MEGVSKVVLEIRHLDIPVGKKVFIVGESGIGKSTILEVLGLMNNTIVPQDDARFVFYDDNGEEIDLIKLWSEGTDDDLSEFLCEITPKACTKSAVCLRHGIKAKPCM